MCIIGFTGSIGCGKSTITNILRSNKFKVIDADEISRNIMKDKEVLETVFETFGYEIKKSDNTLDRKKLADIVFNDEEKLLKLNQITHPRIIELIFSEIEEYREQRKAIYIESDKKESCLSEHKYKKESCLGNEQKNMLKSQYIFIDSALLIESIIKDYVDKILVVTCREDVQIQRIMQRDNCTKKQALDRIKVQMPQEEKEKFADYIINNSTTVENLTHEVSKFIEYMKVNWNE
ncbi:MAG: dephospho-CoA kinase [Clostridioides sp.]|jgi:dephospho-CoA kinase|nr:dephospho-CoA kinase [Clostridioides sp.]